MRIIKAFADWVGRDASRTRRPFVVIFLIVLLFANGYNTLYLRDDVAHADDLQSLAIKESEMSEDTNVEREAPRTPDYVYRAHVAEVYDGDTITVDIDLGFGIWMKDQTIRLYGIDTPELRKEEREQGLKVRNYVRDLILGKDVVIESYKGKKGKYGRWLAVVFYDTNSGQKNLNQELLEKGLAKPYGKD